MFLMDFLKRRQANRRAHKWHAEVTALAENLRPAPTDGTFHLFQYAQLHVFMKAYLGKGKRSQPDQDKILVELIRTHSCKEVAFAACVEELSNQTIKDLLNTSFDVNASTLRGLESYLHAVVAAGQRKDTLYSRNDETFATSIVAVTRDVVNQAIQPATAERLFSTWSTGGPSDPLLLSRSKTLTKKVCQRIETDLSAFETELSQGVVTKSSYTRAIGYKEAFSLLRIASADLEECISSCLSIWRSWANWTPDKITLGQWADVSPFNSFRYLIELEGPGQWRAGSGSTSRRHSLIQTRQLIPWLESKGLSHMGIGLITGDSEQVFIEAFLDAAASVQRESSCKLLHLLISKDGLDLPTLQCWQESERLLQPEFIALLLQRSTLYQGDSDNILIQGLGSLRMDVTGSVSRALHSEIGECVRITAERLLDRFNMSFATGEAWLERAKRLYELRNAVFQSGRLHSMLGSTYMTASRPHLSSSSIEILHELQTAIRCDYGVESHLSSSVDVYIQSFVANGTVEDNETTALPRGLHNLWMKTHRQCARKTACLIATMETLDTEHRLECIKHLQSTPELLANDLNACLASLLQGGLFEVVELTTIVSSHRLPPSRCWQKLLKCAINQCEIHIDRREFTSIGFTAYSEWISRLYDVCGKDVVFLYSVHTWLSEVKVVKSTITALEAIAESGDVIHRILTGHQPPLKDRFLEMLKVLKRQTDDSRFELMQELVLSLSARNSGDILRAVKSISKIDIVGFKQCQNLLVECHENRDVAATKLAIWLRMSKFSTETEAALTSLAKVLQLGHDDALSPPKTSFEPTGKHYATQVAAMVARAQQLEHFRAALRKKDPNGVKAMVTVLELESPSGVQSLIAELPPDLISVVEEAGDDKIELHFALSDLSAMERLAYGLKGTETLYVHLQLNDACKFHQFCVHLEESGEQSSTQDHVYYQSAFPPDYLYCRGRLNRLIYVVSRSLWRATHQQGETSLKVLYEGIQAVIHTAANKCMVCSKKVGAKLHRPTICNSSACYRAFLKSCLDLRLDDIRTDGRVVDLLLTAALAAAVIRKLEYLPLKPPRLDDPAKLRTLLNDLPSTSSLAAATDFQIGLCGFGARSQLLLSYLLNSFRGFVVSATGNYRLPNLPNIHQFLLIDGPPKIEAAFAKHNHLQPRHILFHGTSMDRLYPVLAQGLKVLSGTDMQRHGAVHGPGIYMAREPATALGYASVTQLVVTNFFDSRSDFSNVSVLLGCEHAGADTAARGGGIHVITDPTRVMVRYILTVPKGTKAPRAQDINGPMMSTFNSLRSTVAGPATGDGFAGASS